MQERKEHINIIYPEEGKRYRLNVRTTVSRLTIGKVKQCLAAASSCPIPLDQMVLHLNGVPLSNDRDVCESLGIGNGATLSVEARPVSPQHQRQNEEAKWRQPSTFARHNNSSSSKLDNGVLTTHEEDNGVAADTASASPPFPLSEQRRLLELQTLEQQDAMLNKDVVVRDDILKSTLRHVDDEMDHASLRRRQLERQRESAEEELRRMREKEAAAARERERLATLRAQEAARATERAAQLVERREQLHAEQEAARAVALLKLENEKKKAMLAQQKALLEAERERALLEQDSYEASTKARELELRSREIDMEHQRLARIREARALDADRRLAVQQRLHYYDRLGVEPPRALQREAATLLLHNGDAKNDSDDELTLREDAEERKAVNGGAQKRENGRKNGSATTTKVTTNGNADRHADRDDLVQSRGPSHASTAPGSSTQPASSPSIPHTTAETSSNNNINNSNGNAPLTVPEGGFYDARENAEANLRRLGDDLGLSAELRFDESDTCVISIDGEYTLLVTYDAATERLYLYSTLLATLPPVVQQTPEGRLKLYEFLLEASLLGREMCGGGVGASIRNNFVLMSASLYMPTSQPWSLRTVTPQFLHCLQHWRAKLTEFLAALERETLTEPPSAARVSPSQPVPEPATSSYAADGVSPPWPRTGEPSPQPHAIDPRWMHGAASVSPTRSHVGSVSPSQTPLHQQQQQQPQANHRTSPTTGAAKVVPVLGLEVTGTVLVNGMPTHYDNGVLVVNAAGPSVLAGIQPNDFVEALNNVPIRSVHDFRRVVAEQLTPGMLVPVRINRGGVAMIVTVRVEAAWSL